jgi:type I restriction enzyme S subunit
LARSRQVWEKRRTPAVAMSKAWPLVALGEVLRHPKEFIQIDNLQAKVDALKRLQAETAAELDAMLPSILDQAFKGEL